VFAVFLIVLFRVAKPDVTRADRLMLCFAVPALALVTATGFVTRANGNWAAVSAISVYVLAAAVLVRLAAWRWIAVSLAVGVVAQLILLIGDANATRLSISGLAKPDVYARTMGWRALGEQVEALARRTGAKTVAAERRDVIASLVYYQRDGGRAVLSWSQDTVADHHFDLSRPMTKAAAQPVLLVSSCGGPERLARYYRNVEPLGPIEARTGPTSSRTFFAFLLSNPVGDIGPSGC
jgi:hypothetical protein